eukprot:CAMPEP_0167763136 /NCGR_PEP_ID=MMETSP0110_2-20121227/13177_1 /TAXON_ID=629695 /ORGANISM="Gymnochlora sp., Strain CCMP2014" /LENGTH=570 /DNA_ID=CAMNT_0007650131 /DNA_START=430 /DNA_END=2142 /DNA_ORIENTATION=+
MKGNVQVFSSVMEKVKDAMPKQKFRDRSRQVRSVEHMNRLLDQLPIQKLSVKGDGDTNIESLRNHPVLKLMRQRLEKGYRPGQMKDGCKIALAIEGGGMRGAVSAGMAHAVSVLGLNDAVDCVYGSSAGCIVGAYFISRQVRATGIYRDLLPCAKSRFLDVRELIPALVPARHLESRQDLKEDGLGGLGEVFNLTFLLEDVMGEHGHYPLDWETFARNNKHQELHIVAAAPLTRRSVALSEKEGHFSSLPELFDCMRASMCVPGLAGPPQYLSTNQTGDDLHTLGDNWGKMAGRCEPLVDALLYEPIPYRQAVKDGATHVLVLRTRTEDTEVLGEDNAGGIWEHHICDNYFKRYGLHSAANFMKQLGDKRIYAEDVLTFNQASSGKSVNAPGPFGNRRDSEKDTFIMNLVPDKGCKLAEMEMDREKLLMGLRDGFAAAIDALATKEQLETLGSGQEAAAKFFPTSCLLSEYEFTKHARERLVEAGVKIYQETDRNSRLLKVLDTASNLATLPVRAPVSLFQFIRKRRRERRKSAMNRPERQRSPRAQTAAAPVPIPVRVQNTRADLQRQQ